MQLPDDYTTDCQCQQEKACRLMGQKSEVLQPLLVLRDYFWALGHGAPVLALHPPEPCPLE